MKKEWKNPEIMDLNLENTYEDGLINCPLDENDTDTLDCPPFNGGGNGGNGMGNKKCNVPGCNHKVWGNRDRCKCHSNAQLPNS